MRGVFSTKGPNSSVGGVPVVNCPWRQPHGGRGSGQCPGRSGKRRARDRRDTRKGTRRRTESMNGQPHNVDDHGDDMTRSCRHLSQCGVSHSMKHVRCAGEKVTCEVLLSTQSGGVLQIYLSAGRYCISCLSVTIWQSCNNIHYFCGSHLGRRRALFSKN